MTLVRSASMGNFDALELNGPVVGLDNVQNQDGELTPEQVLELRRKAKLVSEVSVKGSCAITKTVGPFIAAAIEQPQAGPVIVAATTAAEPVVIKTSHAIVDAGVLDKPLRASSNVSDRYCIIL